MLAMPAHWWAVPTLGALMAAGGWGVVSGHGRWLTRSRLGTLLASGGGYLVPLALVDLLPESLESPGADLHRVFAAMALGALAVFVLDRLLGPTLQAWANRLVAEAGPAPGVVMAGHDHEHPADQAYGHTHAHHLAHGHDHDHHGHHAPGVAAACSAIGCLWLCALFDGQVLAASLEAGADIGGRVGFGLVFHMLPEGVMAALLSLAAGHPAPVARRIAVLTGGALVAGALLQWGLAAGSPLMLPFSAGVLLYFALTELLPSAAAGWRGVVEVLAGALLFAGVHLAL
ncbi:MAG: ZIP family metal transporter [Candidatus Sericytochromatia bacterium]|nr:ZIP family metal transporter [Candidatus Sericytochromatia bacterium]